MPSIPTFKQSSQLRTGAPVRIGAATAVTRAIGGLGEEVSRQADIRIAQQEAAIKRQKDADDAAFVTEGGNRLLRQETERLADIETRGADVDLKTLQGDYTDRVNEIADAAPSQESRAEILEQADNAFSRKFFPGYTKHQSNLNVQRRVGATSNAIDDIKSEVLTGRTGVAEAVARTEAALAGLQETAGGVVDIEQARQQAMSGIGQSAITSRIQSGDGLQIVEEISEGKWDQFSTAEELAGFQRQAFKAVQDEESERQAQESQQNALAASDLEINVSRNNATYADIDKALEGGVISPSKRTALYKNLDSNSKAGADIANNLLRVQSSISLGVPLDPTSKEDKAGVEQLWQAVLPDMNPEEFSSSAVSFVQSTGIIPKSLLGNLSAFSRSGNPEQAAQAADIVSRLQDVNSPALRDLTKESYAFGLSVSSLVRNGIDSNKAVEIARKNAFGLTQSEKLATKAILKDASPDNVTFLDTKLDEFDPGISAFQPEVSPVMQAEFQVLLDNLVPFTGGNIDAAREMAWTNMKNVWGATTVNGDIQVMKYAPEAVYGSPDGDNAWISNQFTQDMTEAGLDANATLIGSDVMVARQKNPSYPVFTKDEDGLVTPALDENNLPIRWKPEFKSSPAYKELEVEQNAALESAKGKRKIADTRARWKKERFDKAAKAALEWERAMNDADN